jgi:hypothetical protein
MSDDPNPASPIEMDISDIASAHAPFLYFDHAFNFGYHNGIVSITLEAVRFIAKGQTPARDRVVVAHLRMTIPAAMSLKTALEGALLIAAPGAGQPGPGVARPN